MPTVQDRTEHLVPLLVSNCDKGQVVLMPERRKDAVGVPLIGKRKTDPGHKPLSK